MHRAKSIKTNAERTALLCFVIDSKASKKSGTPGNLRRIFSRVCLNMALINLDITRSLLQTVLPCYKIYAGMKCLTLTVHLDKLRIMLIWLKSSLEKRTLFFGQAKVVRFKAQSINREPDRTQLVFHLDHISNSVSHTSLQDIFYWRFFTKWYDNHILEKRRLF